MGGGYGEISSNPSDGYANWIDSHILLDAGYGRIGEAQMNIFMGGFVYGINGIRIQLPIIKSPSLEMVWNHFESVSGHVGCISMRFDNEDERPDLTLYTDGDNYLLTLLETESESEVRTFWSEGKRGEVIHIHGESYPAGMVFQDPEIARNALAEFCETGDVSKDVLR